MIPGFFDRESKFFISRKGAKEELYFVFLVKVGLESLFSRLHADFFLDIFGQFLGFVQDDL